MGRMGQALVAAAAVAALAAPATASGAPCAAGGRPDARVPSWRAVNGFALGSRPATPAQLDRYLRRVDRATPRVRTFLAGRSAEGRAIRYAAVADPRTLARIGRIAAGLRAVRAGTAPPARVRGFPAFVWLTASVHGNEPSGADADMRLLAQLAAGRTCADRARSRRVVVLMLPAQNPDGRAAGLRANGRGFDLNRDWFARTQPETRAALRALRRFPPVVLADQHEESGTGFFFPPNADPVHHEVPRSTLRAITRTIAPPLRAAFRARGADFVNRSTYDLFFMGFADTATSTLFGAAGMTFEKGGASPYPERSAEQHLAARTLVRAVAARRGRLVGAWARGWRRSRALGRAGALPPNRVLEPGAEVRFAVPDAPVHGYVLYGGDAPALARRLASVGVRVRRLSARATIALRGFGERAAGPAVVPAGAYVVPAAQTLRGWAQALLSDDPYAPVAAFYDVASWSNPLLMGVRGGALTEPLAAPTEPVRPPAAAAPAAAYAFPGGSEASARLALRLLRAGMRVVRVPGGAYAAPGGTATIAAARALGVELAPRDAEPGGEPLRRPRVALLADPAGGPSAAWARWLLAERFGLEPAVLSGEGIAGGALNGRDVLLVPDGAASAADLPAGALTALQAFVAGGGDLVAWRSRGVAVARAAGLTRVRVAPPPPGLLLPGNPVRVALDPASAFAAGEGAESWVYDVGDPVLDAGGAPVVARHPEGERFFVSGYATGTAALRGTPVATAEAVGAGRVTLMAFDPAFRGQAEATHRLLANLLLAAPAGRGAARTAREPARVDPAALAAASPGRDALVRVAAGDEPALAAAARATGLFPRIEHDLGSATLRVAGAAPVDGADPAWAPALLSALRAAGVRPLIVVL